MLKPACFPKIQHLQRFKLVDQHASNDIMNMSNANMIEHAHAILISHCRKIIPRSLSAYICICAQKSVPHSCIPCSALNEKEVYTLSMPCMYVFHVLGRAGGRSSSTAPFPSTRLILVGSECPRRRP